MGKHKKNLSNQKGFTIVELIIASTVFSMVLVVVSSGIIQISRQYYKGITTSRTQETARSVAEEMGDAVQFSGSEVRVTADAICIGNTRYSFVINQQIRQDGPRNALYYDTGISPSSPCVSVFTLGSLPPGKELLSENMRLIDIRVERVANEANLYRIYTGVAYGDNDLLTIYPPNALPTDNPTAGTQPRDALCRPGAGSNFCAVSKLDLTVKKRKI